MSARNKVLKQILSKFSVFKPYGYSTVGGHNGHCIGTYAYVHMYRAGTYAVWGEKKGDMRLVHMRLEEGDMRLGGGPYALWPENTVQHTPKYIRNGWKLSLVIKNTVWRRLRRAKVVF